MSDMMDPNEVNAAALRMRRAMEHELLRKFCRDQGLEWPDENLPAGFWGERVIAVVAALAAVIAGQ